MDPDVLLTFAVAVVICVTGLSATIGHLVRPRPRDRLLLWFGLFAGIYGVRMFLKQPLASTVGLSRGVGLWGEDTLNYIILVPALLFVEELYGRGWRQSLRWLTIAAGLFAIAALVINPITGIPGRVPDPSLAVFAALGLIILVGVRRGYRPPPFPEWRVLLAGLVVFVLFVLNEHAVGNRVVPWRVTAEPLGFLVQIGCFGYIALARIFAQERQLAAVHHEMRSARAIQQAILPRGLPALDRVQIAARYQPLAAVAGDLYDVVMLEDGAVALLVADVAGHGVPAALIASMVKVAFTAALRETREPGVVLERMNSSLCGLFDSSFVTAACVVLHGREASLRYALAGHPSPLLMAVGAEHAVPLDERGIFLGFSAAATYATASIPLPAGGRLVLYTDGVTETAAPDGDLFGVERLAAFAEAERQQGCEPFADGLMDSLRRFAGGRLVPHDDLTLVIVDLPAAGAAVGASPLLSSGEPPRLRPPLPLASPAGPVADG